MPDRENKLWGFRGNSDISVHKFIAQYNAPNVHLKPVKNTYICCPADQEHLGAIEMNCPKSPNLSSAFGTSHLLFIK